ncbi:MAG: ATP-binding cassette domain-containing protein, partial [Candidatus Cloacimonetes bacterium]|nr:ATP-binding cassette domain-containing protein [Candidatus Cloacimonadota bacterium]
KRNPFTLSEGEKRRLSLAILWNLDREVFLLDEPTFGQDILNKERLISMIEKMRNQGKSFIIASHDLPFVKAVSSRIMKLKNGKLEEING